MDTLKVSYSGVRGIVGVSLTRETAWRYGHAFGHIVAARDPGATVLLARDTRPSGPDLREGLLAGLEPFGFRLVELGVVPTPTAQFCMEPFGAGGAVVITASHNPQEWNGFKFLLGPERTVLDGEQTDWLIRWVREVGPAPAGAAASPAVEDRHEEAVTLHVQRVLEQVDVEAVRRARFRVALDAGGGAGREPASRLLHALGCEVSMVDAVRDSEPLPENLGALRAAVVEHRCHLGLAQDLDADRLALVGEGGEALGEESTLVLAVDHLLRRFAGHDMVVVRNVATTRAIDVLAGRSGARVVETRVGEVNLSRALAREMAGGAVAFGGEGSGGVIVPRVAFGRDSLTGAALILEALAVHGRPITEVLASLPAFPMARCRVKLGLPETLEARFEAVRALYPEAAEERPDGLRLLFPGGGWVLVRPSNTEPVARIVVQGPDETWAEETLTRVREVFVG